MLLYITSAKVDSVLSCAKEVWFVSLFICPVALFLFVGGVLSSKVEKVREMKGKDKNEEILGCG